MKHLLATIVAAIAIATIGFANAGEDREPPSVHEQHENPMFEMGQIITCQAMHLVLGHMYAVSAASLSLLPGNNDTATIVQTETDLANKELAKAKYITKVAKEAVIPTLLARGLPADRVEDEVNSLLQETLASIGKVANNPLAPTEAMNRLMVLLQQQSIECDTFVATTENRHTI